MELNNQKIGLFIHISEDGDDWNSITTHTTTAQAKEVLYKFIADNWVTFGGMSEHLYDYDRSVAIEHFFSSIDASYVICELGSTDLDNSVTYASSD